METTDAWIRERTGIEERHWVRGGDGELRPRPRGDEEGALAKAGWEAKDIEAIVYATLSSDHMFPGDGCYLNAKLGIPGVPALDVRNQCSGFLYGLSVADAWIRIGMYGACSSSASEIHSTGLDVSTRGRDVAVIFGDGAGAALPRGDRRPGPRRALLPPPRRRSLRDGPLVRRARVDLPPAPPAGDARRTASIYPRMEGPKVFKHAVVRMPEVVREALDAERRLTRRTSSCSIPHQANLRIAQMVQRSLELRDDQVFNNIQKYGNTTAASIPIALAEAVEARGVGAGISSGCAPSGRALLGRAP